MTPATRRGARREEKRHLGLTHMAVHGEVCNTMLVVASTRKTAVGGRKLANADESTRENTGNAALDWE